MIQESELKNILNRLSSDEKYDLLRYAYMLRNCQRLGRTPPDALSWLIFTERNKRSLEKKIQKELEDYLRFA